MIKFNKRTLVKLKRRLHKHASMLMAILIFIEISWPTGAYALTGGPSQPEVQSFEPIGTSDMVDMFSGDFSYNLPLMDVEGYPINIAYHSGVNTDQEASWVGLGWNINPGVINRNMRGLPDDFSGENVTKKFNMKPNKTWGVAANAGIELFGAEGDVIGIGLGVSYGFNFNNYNGPSITKSFNVNISAGESGGGKLNAGLGLTSSSDDGLTVQPSIGFSAKINSGGNTETSLGVNIGTAFNSRGGLKQLSISASASVSYKGSDERVVKDKQGNDVLDKDGNQQMEYYSKGSASLGSQGAGGTFDFGQATYTPKVDMPMKNFSMSGSFTLSGEIWGLTGKVGVSGFYSAQELAQTTINNPAYGYLYAEKGQYDDNALMDFNREKDGTFTENTPSLPLTNFTFDTYGVSGQGIGGSYRPFRGDIGYVFDAKSYTSNNDDALTAEVGMGGYVHLGTNVNVIDVLSQSGRWTDNNAAAYSMVHTDKGDGNDFENVYFKEANEKTVESDTSFYETAGRDNPVRFDIDLGEFDHSLKNGFVNQYGQTKSYSGPIRRKSRDKKTQNISFLKSSEYSDFAIDNSYNSQLSSAAKPYHIAEVTTLGTDGARYIYGIAAYNTQQKELTFSVGSTNMTSHDNNGALNKVHNTGLVKYTASDNSLSNTKGLDNYFSSTETPGYAHSYLLTAVLSPDYIDADAVRGPSDKDFGNYTKFKYEKLNDFQWRTPASKDSATYSEGLKSDYTDDKANIIYGKKDLYYLDSVITKNYIAVFHKSFRQDGLGVIDENGGVSTGSKVKRLDSISLYSKRDLKTPLKRVHFEYTYNLCKGVTNSSVAGGGKLTLKKIYFTYQSSNRARMSPYVFDYHEGNAAENPDYNVKAYDRWGNFKKNNATTIGVMTNGTSGKDAASFIGAAPLPPSDYPYVDPDTLISNVYAAAWNLKEINLPSGGTIKVSYEADDYAYVQDKQAGQMFKIVDYKAAGAPGTPGDQTNSISTVDFSGNSGRFYFKPLNGITDMNKYMSNLHYIYFRFLVNIKSHPWKHLEYVSGYGEFKLAGYDTASGLCWVELENVDLKDNGGTSVNPVVKAAINFGRIHMPKVVWDATNGSVSGTLSGSILQALVNSSFIKNIRDAVAGPSETLFQNYNVGKSFVAGKSWMRFNNPDGHKLGGGVRVRKIAMIDNWQTMAGGGSNGETTGYGQEYNYNLEDGRSSGVAAYEPQLGGDENPFKQPIFSTTKMLLVPDDQSYVEEPFGESFFPSASVGYSRVTVKNIQRTNVTRHATGKVVHEFYTAQDFPTITKRTRVEYRRGKDDPTSLRSLLKIDVRDYLSATQGFVIELNDMHGKPKSQKVYQESQTVPITSVEYKYKCDPYLNGSFKLNNSCQVIEKSGKISQRNIGMFFDMVGDMRESKTETKSTTVQINVDVIPIYAIPVPIPGIWPSFAKDKKRFRSATLTKVVQRFGIQEETIASDLGSVVSTKNMAYDAQTGYLLLTQTTTNYNDKIYSFKYPAWWYYDLMGPSYENLGFEQSNVSMSGGIANLSSAYLFKEGDEVAFKGGGNVIGWVDQVNGNNVSFISKNGSALANGTYSIKILRSGKRNNLTTDMATITTLTDPLASLNSNAYQNVIQASAVEFSNRRKTHCDCISKNTVLPYTSNPFVNGIKGTWRPLKSYTHLTTRTQSNVNKNSNIRKDGVFESYTPFYKLAAGNWGINAANWTYISEVTEFNVFGMEVENKDALTRYSSATFGYNQTQALSVAANSQFKEQGFDGFEDYRFNPCIDDHFKIATNDTNRTESHTGRYSLKVQSGAPKYFNRQIDLVCETPPECSMVINHYVSPATGYLIVEALSGTGPYTMTWNVVSGSVNNPVFTVIGPAKVQVSSLGTCIISFTVKDKSGCTKTVTVKYK